MRLDYYVITVKDNRTCGKFHFYTQSIDDQVYGFAPISLLVKFAAMPSSRSPKLVPPEWELYKNEKYIKSSFGSGIKEIFSMVK